MKIHEGKNGAYVTFEKLARSGMYKIMVRNGGGAVLDKITCDDYRTACEYRRAFIKLAKAS